MASWKPPWVLGPSVSYFHALCINNFMYRPKNKAPQTNISRKKKLHSHIDSLHYGLKNTMIVHVCIKHQTCNPNMHGLHWCMDTKLKVYDFHPKCEIFSGHEMMEKRFVLYIWFKLFIYYFPIMIPTVCPFLGDINNASINPLKKT